MTNFHLIILNTCLKRVDPSCPYKPMQVFDRFQCKTELGCYDRKLCDIKMVSACFIPVRVKLWSLLHMKSLD